MLWRARGEDCRGRERKSEYLNYRRTNPRAVAESENGFRLGGGGCAVCEKGERYREHGIDDGSGSAVADTRLIRQELSTERAPGFRLFPSLLH